MKTPFFDKTGELARLDTRFFVPGHKGKPAAIPRFGEWLRYDLTEIEGADDLSCPGGSLAQSEDNMAGLYGSGTTLYSAFGATSCIQAMLTLFVPPGAPVVMVRGCHTAAVRALAFLDAAPVWVLPRAGRAEPQAIEAALRESGAGAVYLTSPDYYGRTANLPAIAQICRAAGARLLVDNAHGAHLCFLPQNTHPISLGADACADSAHKTLPCLTPAALLHLRDKTLKTQARQALNLYSSTSPSYPVLQSLDWAAGVLASGGLDFAGAAAQCAALAKKHRHLFAHSDDPLKLCLRPAAGGWPAAQVTKALAAAHIQPELADDERIVLMASPFNTAADYALLDKTLRPFVPKPPQPTTEEACRLPQLACSVRQAVFGAKQRLNTAAAKGRTMAGIAAPCPPGVPLVLPGEVIDEQAVRQLLLGGISQVDVVK